ncbi:DinB family protein [Telmatobacter sp. DSM 110680]|uniref:DinB family protein n=1 Tax=Telmatobacter sp. DSM 110680 TaxID=3036704 RepID=A0AAU7DHN0_9BACT
MSTRQSQSMDSNSKPEVKQSADRLFAVNERINQLLIKHLDPAAWTAKPPGNVRTIAAIFTHMHNVRAKWIRLTAPHLKVPAQLNRSHCTPQQARKALAASAVLCEQMLEDVETGRIHKGKRIEQFVRDGWARPWPVGPGDVTAMLSYMLVHEAHHRGQVAMIAHKLGFPLSKEVTSKMWSWEKL